MSKGHNKKRNVGIVYEQLLATAASAMVEGDKSRANTALKIVKKYFVPGTELYREFRLFNALLKTHVTSDALASRILEESKSAATQYDLSRLRAEKSGLIKEINHSLGKEDFYKTAVSDYKMMATIHTLLEEWRAKTPDVSRRVQYEAKLHSWLLSPRTDQDLNEMKTPDINDLTVRLMRESFNKKFGDSLSENQKEMIRLLVFEGDTKAVVDKVREQVRLARRSLSLYESQCDSAHVRNKIPDVLQMLESLDPEDTSDSNVAKFMTVAQLCDELMGDKE